MPSIRWVTRKPPTTLMVAKTMEAKPRIVVSVECWAPAARIAPTRVIPLMAFEPDISGVWRVGGTLVITSNPTKMASTKIVMLNIKPSIQDSFREAASRSSTAA
jgi:hypothetical protein